MYRIEVAPGEITVFRTIDELATAVRNGVITSKARIYHGASEKWLPIEFHPHYKQALKLLAGRGADSHASKPPERSSGSALVFLNVPISPLATIPPAPAAQAPAPPVVPEPVVPTAQAPTPPMVPEPVVPAARPEPVMPAAPIDRTTFHEEETESGSPVEEPGVQHPRVHASLAVEARIHRTSAHEAEDREARAHRSPLHQSRVQEEAVRHWTAPPSPTHESPVDYSPVYDLPVHESPVHESPVHESPLHESPAQPSPLHETPASSSAVRVPPVKAPVLEERLVEAPRPRPTLEELFAPPTTQRLPVLPPVSASPVLELPKISYPEFTPAEPPVAERSTGSARARRPLHLAGAVILLAAGGYASTMVFPFGRSDGGFSAASTMADRPIVPAKASAPRDSAGAPAPVAPRTASPSTVAMPPAPSPATGPAAVAPSRAPAARPADDTPLPPASSGFAPALEPRAMVAPPKPAPTPVAADSTSIAAPAIDMDVAAPTLQAADSVAGPPRQKGDSAMKKILRALNGGKTLP